MTNNQCVKGIAPTLIRGLITRINTNKGTALLLIKPRKKRPTSKNKIKENK